MKAISLLLVLAACTRDLSLPSPPQVQIASVAPGAGYAGTRVHVTGTHLRGASGVEIRVGDSKYVSPLPAADASDSAIDFIVPEDATTGPILITNSAGRAASAQPFVFRGVGHPTLNAVTRTADLRAVVATAFLSGDTMAMLDADHGWAGLIDPVKGSVISTLAPAGVAEALAPVGNSTLLALVDEQPGAACPGAFGKVTLFDGGSPAPSLAPACLPRPAGATFEPHTAVRAEADHSGNHLLVASASFAWLVDFSVAPAAVTAFPVQGQEPPRLAFGGVSNTWFLLADAAGLHQVDWTRSPPMGDALPLARSTLCLAVSTDDAGSSGAFCSGSDVDLIDLTTWPPTGVSKTLTGFTGDLEAVAFNGTQRLAAISRQGSVVYDLNTSAPLASAPLKDGRQVRAAPGGLFAVGTRGGATLLSAESGLPIAAVPLHLGASTPQLHLDGTGAKVIDVFLRTLGAVQRVAASDLSLSPSPILLAPGASAIAAAPASSRLYAVHANGDLGEVLGRIEPLPLRHVVSPGPRPPELLATPGGEALLVRYDAAAAGGDWHEALLDAAHWSSAPVRDFALGSTAGVEGFAAADGAHLALLRPDSTRLFALADVLGGRTEPTATLPRAGALLAGAIAGGDLFLLEQGAGTPQLSQVPLDGAPASPAQPVAAWTAIGTPTLDEFVLAVAVSGRRLYTLDAVGGRTCQLSTLVYDPQQHKLGAELPRVDLPPGCTELLPYPDEPRLLVVDGDADQLLVIE